MHTPPSFGWRLKPFVTSQEEHMAPAASHAKHPYNVAEHNWQAYPLGWDN